MAKANKGRKLIREVNGIRYERIPVKTHVIKPGEDFASIVKKYTRGKLKKGDIIVAAESAVAISQGRAVPENEIKVGLWASILWRFVTNSPYGVGLHSPLSMQCAIDEVGLPRILFAAVIAGFARLFKKRGVFYKIAGMQAALIDGAHTSPVEPYNKCVIKGPKDPDKVAQSIKEATGMESAVMDINDIGGSWAIGATSGIDKPLLEDIMRDNPLGQGKELTPICIVRKAK